MRLFLSLQHRGLKMTNQTKKIAVIFEEQMVFLTKMGKYYNYEWEDGHLRCHKMSRAATKAFINLYLQQVKTDEAQMMSWQPVAHLANPATDNHLIRMSNWQR